jgi:hypothetical protein
MFSIPPKQPDPHEQESQSNLVGFFDLLLKIDRRNHPELYQKQANSQEQNHD